MRYNDNVNRDIMKYIETENSNKLMNIKQKGITSSIPIAAAITA